MKLCYINAHEEDSFGVIRYEILFTKQIDDVEGDGWLTPHPSPPDFEFIDMVIDIETKNITLKTFDEDGMFPFYEYIDRVHALAWEDLNDLPETRNKRIVLHFGDDIIDVLHHLYKAGTNYKVKLFI